MARKQETPASTAKVKDPVSPTEPTTVQPEGGSLPPSPDPAALPNSGEDGPPATDPGLADSTGQGLPVGQASSSFETDAAATNQAADTNAPVTGADDSEGAGQVGLVATDGGKDSDQLVGGEDLVVNPNPVVVQIYPMRSYMDEGELRRRGGPAYSVPRRHAEELVQRKLADLDPLKE